MKLLKSLLAVTCVLVLSSGLAEAAPKKSSGKNGRSAAELVVVNERAVEVVSLTIADQTGKPVGKLAAPIAPGKRASIKLAKAAGCMMNVSTVFADDSELEGTTDACKDKTLKLKD